jgi:hypothetical protein
MPGTWCVIVRLTFDVNASKGPNEAATTSALTSSLHSDQMKEAAGAHEYGCYVEAILACLYKMVNGKLQYCLVAKNNTLVISCLLSDAAKLLRHS